MLGLLTSLGDVLPPLVPTTGDPVATVQAGRVSVSTDRGMRKTINYTRPDGYRIPEARITISHFTV